MIETDFMKLCEQLDKYNGPLIEALTDDEINIFNDTVAQLTKVLAKYNFQVEDYDMVENASNSATPMLKLEISGELDIEEDDYSDDLEDDWDGNTISKLDTSKIRNKLDKILSTILYKEHLIDSSNYLLQDQRFYIDCDDQDCENFETEEECVMYWVKDTETFDGRRYDMGYSSSSCYEGAVNFTGYTIYIVFEE